jgi:hypothetical protein
MTGPLPISIGNNLILDLLILDLAIYSDQNLCQNQNSVQLLAESKNQTIS